MIPDTEGKSLVELLEMLYPAPAPEPISMLPQTWGWAVLAACFVAVLIFGIVLALRHRRANAYRRQALVELDGCSDDSAQIALVLRRAALAAYPRAQVASLVGDDWMNFLKQSADISQFSDSTLQALVNAPYRKGATVPGGADLARHWIKSHRPERPT